MGRIVLSLMLALTFTVLLWYIILTDTKKENKYILKTYEDNIALFKNGKVEEIYDTVTIWELPDKDINLLNEGIKLKSKEQALQYVEDYDG